MEARFFKQPGDSGLRSSKDVDWLMEWGVVCLMGLVVIGAVVAMAHSSVPYLWLSIAVGTMLLLAACLSAGSLGKAFWINLAAIVLTCGGAEEYFWLSGPSDRQMEYSEGFFARDELLGYGPSRGRAVSHVTRVGNRQLYHVTYTIDDYGLRVAGPPDESPGKADSCLVFFGDSFTFGEGVPDEATMPYRVGRKVRGNFRTVNFGFLGYGPHQMLAILEEHRIDALGACRPHHVFYQAIPAHVSRVAGLEPWDQHGPRYVLTADGRVIRAGHFDEAPPETLLDSFRRLHHSLTRTWQRRLEQSALYRTLLHSHRPVTERDVELFTRVIGAAQQIIHQRYPEAAFHVLLWDFEEDRSMLLAVEQGLENQRVRVYSMSSILPDFHSKLSTYEISPYDKHPNERAYELIAEYVARHIVDPAPHMTAATLPALSR
jgi:hypothetical protein